MKRLVWVGAVLAAIAVLTVGVKRVLDKGSNIDPLSAEMVRVTRRDVGPVVKATGVIKPMVGAEVRVGSSASGVVSRLYVRIGDNVKTGTVLADVDSRELDARRDVAEAAVRLAKANLDYAQTDRRRKQELFNAQVIARSELDLAEQAYGVADQQYKQAQANLADAMTQLGYTRIVAPISGTVESVTTQEGETVASYVFDLWVDVWRKKCARGDVVVVRYADDNVLGFQYRADADRFLDDFRERLGRFGLQLNPDKTRRIEFGRFAELHRIQRGEGKPETFDFLGFTHISGKDRNGNFVVKRKTIGKRMRAKLEGIKQQLQ
jgi:biotin carboxyl carrier protein